MKNVLVLGVTAAVMFSVCGGALAESQWRHAASLGMRRFVVVEPGATGTTEIFMQAARQLCFPGQACGVVFMRDDAAVPKKMPLTRAQQQSVIAQFFRNPVDGNEELLLKCKADEPIEHKCLR
ncbi:MAG: hypothetical protein Q7U91_13100 [Sideroxyarcus sp.]|nr:hypothetical protein [Sideroxyarcus sp.]